MSHSKLTQWIEDADAREICRDAAFFAAVEQQQYIHLGAIVAKVAELWRHNVTDTVVRHESSVRH